MTSVNVPHIIQNMSDTSNAGQQERSLQQLVRNFEGKENDWVVRKKRKTQMVFQMM